VSREAVWSALWVSGDETRSRSLLVAHRPTRAAAANAEGTLDCGTQRCQTREKGTSDGSMTEQMNRNRSNEKVCRVSRVSAPDESSMSGPAFCPWFSLFCLLVPLSHIPPHSRFSVETNSCPAREARHHSGNTPGLRSACTAPFPACLERCTASW